MPHGRHIYSKAKSIICAYPQSDHSLPYRKCVLKCCAKCPCVNLTYQGTDDQYSNTSPSILFHIYRLIACCTTHGRLLLNDKKLFCKCKHYSVSEKST